VSRRLEESQRLQCISSLLKLTPVSELQQGPKVFVGDWAFRRLSSKRCTETSYFVTWKVLLRQWIVEKFLN